MGRRGDESLGEGATLPNYTLTVVARLSIRVFTVAITSDRKRTPESKRRYKALGMGFYSY
jgi:hypothetical protein